LHHPSIPIEFQLCPHTSIYISAELHAKMAEINKKNASDVIKIDERIFCLLLNVAKVPKMYLKSVVHINLYDFDELVAATKLMFHLADSVPMDGLQPLPRSTSRKPGDKKRRLDVNDVYNLLFQLD